MTSGVQLVTKSLPVVVVPSPSGPAPLTAGETVRLSPFDRCVAPFPVTMLLAFDRPIQEPAETIKSALSRALAHYRPIAGRLRLTPRPGVDDDGEEPCIACTDEGITFVGASASCALEDVTTAQLTDLVIRYPGDLCRDTEPLLLLQVTEFTCGGFTVGVTFNHVVADGSGFAQFLRSVGELARRAPQPSVVPVRRWDDGLPSLPESTVAAQKSTMTHGRKDLARVDVVVPFSLISGIKAESGGTVFDVVTAVLWRCRTRAIMSAAAEDDPETPAPLAFPSDVRARVGAEAGYYGNCVVVQLVPATTRAAVASTGIGDLVALIRRAKEKIPDLLLPAGASPDPSPSEEQGTPAFDDAAAAGAAGTAVAAAEGGGQEEMKLAYNALVVANWRTLGVDGVDFGGGVPASVTWHEERAVVPGCVACPPCRNREDDGVRVAAICVKTEHAGAFLEELVSMGTRVLPSNLWASA